MKFFLVCLLISISLLSIMSCNFDMIPNQNVKSQEGLIPNQINNRTTFPVTVPDPILSQHISQEQP